MVKILRISGYQSGITTKYGVQDKIMGLAYQNRYSNTVGIETSEVWLPSGMVALSPDLQEKDLYVEYGQFGRPVACQIK